MKINNNIGLDSRKLENRIQKIPFPIQGPHEPKKEYERRFKYYQKLKRYYNK
jgi:hypothetical protein